VIDLHSHVLAGIDDGPASPEGSLAMMRAASAAGITTIVATPHVSGRYRNDPDTIARAAEVLSAPLRRQGDGVELLLGAEVSVTRIAELEEQALPRLCLGDGPWLLLEPPFTTVVPGLDTAVADLHRRGHRVLLAHPERCPAFHRDPAALEALLDAGVLTSVTSGSLVGRFGGEARRLALSLLETGLAHNVASDAHDDLRRPPSIADELRAAGGEPLQDWLTWEVPSAILAGAEIPRRPAVTLGRIGRRRWPWSGRRQAS
jgi:protein-tyrosine phosphatase